MRGVGCRAEVEWNESNVADLLIGALVRLQALQESMIEDVLRTFRYALCVIDEEVLICVFGFGSDIDDIDLPPLACFSRPPST